jgi:hypothetical protein
LAFSANVAFSLAKFIWVTLSALPATLKFAMGSLLPPAVTVIAPLKPEPQLLVTV